MVNKIWFEAKNINCFKNGFKVIKGLSDNKSDNSKIEKEVQKEIVDLCAAFPIYGN